MKKTEPASSTHRLFQNRFKGAHECNDFCLIRKIVPKDGTTVAETPLSKFFAETPFSKFFLQLRK
jgi:hypothetical protein